MKKILKNNMTKPIKCQCKDCGSLFEFDYTDIQRREETSLALLYGSSTFTVRFVVCPVCAYENKFEDIKKNSIKLALDEWDIACEKLQSEKTSYSSNDSEKEEK